MTRFFRRAAVLSIASVVVVLLGQLATLGHYVFVAHYLCAEHGTLHHGRAPAAHAVERAQPREASVAPGYRGEHGSHDECAFPARERQAVEPPAAAGEIALPTFVLREISSNETSAREATKPIYAVAPKQSPPEVV